MDNIQKKISRVRSPRVQITYDLETNGAKILKKLPYILCILADIAGDSEKVLSYKTQRFMNLNASNIQNIMEYLDVRVKILSPIFKSNNPNSQKLINISLFGIDAFHPDQLINNTDFLKVRHNTLTLLKDLKRKLTVNDISMDSILKILGDPKAMGEITDYPMGKTQNNPQSDATINSTEAKEKNKK
jgi:type VI secretion system ImpB/VipA family protein